MVVANTRKRNKAKEPAVVVADTPKSTESQEYIEKLFYLPHENTITFLLLKTCLKLVTLVLVL